MFYVNVGRCLIFSSTSWMMMPIGLPPAVTHGMSLTHGSKTPQHGWASPDLIPHSWPTRVSAVELSSQRSRQKLRVVNVDVVRAGMQDDV